VALAAGVVSLAAALVLAAMLTETPALFGWGLGLCATILPPAIGAAILRYRLYDLDRIISRTLAYTLLTVLLGLGYAGLVLGLGQFLGKTSSLAVAGATLAVAAAFQPARRRISRRPTGASTAAATTPPRPSRRSAPGCASRSTSTP
jgi:hypothetical protein